MNVMEVDQETIQKIHNQCFSIINNKNYNWKNYKVFVPQKYLQEKTLLVKAIESVVGTSMAAGVIGYVAGGFMGLFMSNIHGVDPTIGNSGELSVKQVWLETKTSMKSYAKNFAAVGFLFSLFQGTVEKYRAKHDIWNEMIAGGLTGGLMGFRNGPRMGFYGGISFAAFSAAITLLLENRPSH